MHEDQLVRLVAEINPIKRPEAHLGSADALFATARNRFVAITEAGAPAEFSERRRKKRFIAAIAIGLCLLTLPTAAFSGLFGSLFNFSASTTVGGPTALDETSSTFLERLHLPPDSLRKIAVRDQTAFYVARTASGHLCVGVGPAVAPTLSVNKLACGSGGEDSFPSPQVPVFQASPVFGVEGSDDVFLRRLDGFAADGITAVAISGPSGIVARAPVMNNVFAADVPRVPVTSIAAYDDSGQKVWDRPLLPR